MNDIMLCDESTVNKKMSSNSLYQQRGYLTERARHVPGITFIRSAQMQKIR